jgi:hypothetical protein
MLEEIRVADEVRLSVSDVWLDTIAHEGGRMPEDLAASHR